MKKREPTVSIPMSEHDQLLRLAGLEPGKHGLSDLSRTVRELCKIEQSLRLRSKGLSATEQIGLQTLNDIRHRR